MEISEPNFILKDHVILTKIKLKLNKFITIRQNNEINIKKHLNQLSFIRLSFSEKIFHKQNQKEQQQSLKELSNKYYNLYDQNCPAIGQKNQNKTIDLIDNHKNNRKLSFNIRTTKKNDVLKQIQHNKSKQCNNTIDRNQYDEEYHYDNYNDLKQLQKIATTAYHHNNPYQLQKLSHTIHPILLKKPHHQTPTRLSYYYTKCLNTISPQKQRIIINRSRGNSIDNHDLCKHNFRQLTTQSNAIKTKFNGNSYENNQKNKISLNKRIGTEQCYSGKVEDL